MTKQENNENDEALKPTGTRMSLEKIIEGMEFQSETSTSYLNTATGDIVWVSEEALDAIDNGEEIDPVTGETLDEVRDAIDGKDYIQLPDSHEIDDYRIMERFVRYVVDEAASSELLNALSMPCEGWVRFAISRTPCTV